MSLLFPYWLKSRNSRPRDRDSSKFDLFVFLQTCRLRSRVKTLLLVAACQEETFWMFRHCYVVEMSLLMSAACAINCRGFDTFGLICFWVAREFPEFLMKFSSNPNYISIKLCEDLITSITKQIRILVKVEKVQLYFPFTFHNLKKNHTVKVRKNVFLRVSNGKVFSPKNLVFKCLLIFFFMNWCCLYIFWVFCNITNSTLKSLFFLHELTQCDFSAFVLKQD